LNSFFFCSSFSYFSLCTSFYFSPPASSHLTPSPAAQPKAPHSCSHPGVKVYTSWQHTMSTIWEIDVGVGTCSWLWFIVQVFVVVVNVVAVAYCCCCLLQAVEHFKRLLSLRLCSFCCRCHIASFPQFQLHLTLLLSISLCLSLPLSFSLSLFDCCNDNALASCWFTLLQTALICSFFFSFVWRSFLACFPFVFFSSLFFVYTANLFMFALWHIFRYPAEIFSFLKCRCKFVFTDSEKNTQRIRERERKREKTTEIGEELVSPRAGIYIQILSKRFDLIWFNLISIHKLCFPQQQYNSHSRYLLLYLYFYIHRHV